MRIFVDELPNCCGNCGFCCKDDLGYWCQAREVVYIADETLGEKRLHSCPLQSLSDYTKQVRKEVCEEIKKKATIGYYEEYDGFDRRAGKTYIIRDCDLNQIQGEDNGNR